MSNVYLWAIASYFLLLVLVAVRGSRGVSTQEDFSVAGRSLGTFVLSFTMIATWIGSGSFFGNSEKTYEVGLAAWINPSRGISHWYKSLQLRVHQHRQRLRTIGRY